MALLGGHEHTVAAIVGVEHDRVERARILPEHVADVIVHHADARIVHRLDGQVVLRVGVPGDDFRHELRDDDLGVITQVLERGSEREAQPKPADEHANARQLPERRTRDLGKPILGEVAAGGHELHAIGANEVRAVVPIQRDQRPVRRPRLAKSLERLHRLSGSTRAPSDATQRGVNGRVSVVDIPW